MATIITSQNERKNNEINRIIRSRNTYHEKYLETWGWDYGI